MTTIILILHIFLAASMIGIILIQRSEGGALGMGGGSMGGFMTARGTANLLTRVTAVLASSFFITTLVLAILFKGSQKQVSILDQEPQVPVAEMPLPSGTGPESPLIPQSETPPSQSLSQDLQRMEDPEKAPASAQDPKDPSVTEIQEGQSVEGQKRASGGFMCASK